MGEETSVRLIIHLHLVLTLRMTELYLHSHILIEMVLKHNDNLFFFVSFLRTLDFLTRLPIAFL